MSEKAMSGRRTGGRTTKGATVKVVTLGTVKCGGVYHEPGITIEVATHEAARLEEIGAVRPVHDDNGSDAVSRKHYDAERGTEDCATMTKERLEAEQTRISAIDELAQVNGVGPELAPVLYADGYMGVDDLANAAPANLVKHPGIGKRKARQIIEDAKTFEVVEE